MASIFVFSFKENSPSSSNFDCCCSPNNCLLLLKIDSRNLQLTFSSLQDVGLNNAMNFTQCQEPLRNFTATLNSTITTQKPEWWPSTYIRFLNSVNTQAFFSSIFEICYKSKIEKIRKFNFQLYTFNI